MADTFPLILSSEERRDYPACPTKIPLSLIAPHEKQAIANHCGQDLKTLARRGGLGVVELYYVLKDERFPFTGSTSTANAVFFLMEKLTERAKGEL